MSEKDGSTAIERDPKPTLSSSIAIESDSIALMRASSVMDRETVPSVCETERAGRRTIVVVSLSIAGESV